MAGGVRVEREAETELQATVKPSERMSKHQRHDQNSSAEDKHMVCLAQVEGPDATDKKVTDCQIYKAP